MDGVSGLEEGAKSVFPQVTVQRCIVHLIRNSIRYIPRKQWSAFTKQLKLIYGAINVTKKGAFPHEDAVFKIFYLRILELYKKWEGRHVANWAMVRNQLLMDDRMSQLMQQYDVAY